MKPGERYFTLPRDYAAWLGGLSWQETGEVIEYADQSTFIFPGQVMLFLDGYTAQGPLIHFAYMLHLLSLLGYGRRPSAAEEMQRAFTEAGRPLRNAGAFCAVLCRQIPPHPEPLEGSQLFGFLSTFL